MNFSMALSANTVINTFPLKKYFIFHFASVGAGVKDYDSTETTSFIWGVLDSRKANLMITE